MSWFHEHKWKIVDVKLYQLYQYQDGNKITQDITLILYFCDCGSHKTKRLLGSWTLKQLCGASLGQLSP